jgi:hypothetical protein
MRKSVAKLVVPLFCALLLLCLSTNADAEKGWKGGGGGCNRVAEPAAVLLLGTGLVSLAVYAKKKNGKK